MNEDFNLDVIAKDFEDYFSKTRGITVAAFGIDMTAHMEQAARTAFYIGYANGLVKAAEKLKIL